MMFSKLVTAARGRINRTAAACLTAGAFAFGVSGLVSASDLTVTGLTDGQALTSSTKVEALVDDSLPTRAVGFDLVGPTTRRHIEMIAPYVLFGDNSVLDPSNLADGEYTLVVKVANSSWRVIAEQSIDFTVGDVVPVEDPVDNGGGTPTNGGGTTTTPDDSADDAADDSADSADDSSDNSDSSDDVRVRLSGLPSGGVLGSPVKVEATVTGAEVSRVDFSLSGERSSFHRELFAPYIYKGDNSRLNPNNLPDGDYTMKATAYDSRGNRLASSAVVFRVGAPADNGDSGSDSGSDNGSSDSGDSDAGSSDDDADDDADAGDTPPVSHVRGNRQSAGDQTPDSQHEDNQAGMEDDLGGGQEDDLGGQEDDLEDGQGNEDTVDNPTPGPGKLWVTGLSQGQVLTSPTKVSAGLSVGSPTSIDFRLSGPANAYHRENIAPYVYKGDNALLDPSGLPGGAYTMRVTALGVGGSVIEEMTVAFSIPQSANDGDGGLADGGDTGSGDAGNGGGSSSGGGSGSDSGSNDGGSGGDSGSGDDDGGEEPTDGAVGNEDDANDDANDDYDYGDDTPTEPGDLYADRDDLDEWGWTVVNIPSDVRRIYLSNNGNDANDGATPETAIATLERAEELNKQQFGQPFAMLLHAGHKFQNRLNLEMPQGTTSKSTKDRPIVIGVYGDGPRPKVFGRLRVVKVREINHLRVVGIQFTEGIDYHTPGTDILIEDCLFIASGININGFQGAINDVRLRRNIVVDNFPRGGHSQGAYLDRITGLLIEENVFDHNGWAPGQPEQRTIFNHNIYVQSSGRDCVVRNNIITRGSSHGLQLRPGGVIEDNVFLRNATGVYAGRGDEDAGAWVRRNIFAEADDIGAGHNMRGWGYEIHATWYGTIEHNVFMDRASSNPHPGMHAKPDYWENNREPIVVRHNRVENWVNGNGQGFVINPKIGNRITLEVNNLVNGVSQVTGQQIDLVDRDRRYQDYVAKYGNGGGFDELMDRVRTRPRGQWDTKWSGKEISAWVRAGFSVSPTFD